MTTLLPGLFTSIRHDWATPKALFDKLDQEFNFTLDACANAENTKCVNYFSENALVQPWPGSVWCNPPYGRVISKWIAKAYAEQQTQTSESVVLLLPARTDTRWFHDYCLKGEIRFLKNRLHFDDSHGRAPFPSMVVIFR